MSRPTFDAVYEGELPYVLRSLRRLGIPPRDLEDVAHDVFMVVHRKLSAFDAKRPLRPWLFGIAFRVASAYRRKHSNKYEHLERKATSEPGPCRNRSTDPWPRQQARQLVLQALETLPLEPRAVFILHDIDGATAGEISETLKIPVNRVYSRLRIARRDFRAAIAKLQEEPS